MATVITDAIVARMKEMAPLDMAKAETIAAEFDVKARSIIASASRNKIPYNRKVRASKTGEPVVTKADLVATIAMALDVEAEKLDGLDKANKTALSVIANAVG